jgi:hypothetical protein
MFQRFCTQTELSGAWGRISYSYGPHEHRDRLVPTVIRSLLQGLPARCSEGSQIRDFLHDVASASVGLLDSEVAGPVNIASGRPVAVREVIYNIADKLGRRDLIQLGVVPVHAGQPPVLIADTTRLVDEVGWSPEYDLDSGLHQTIEWWHEQTPDRAVVGAKGQRATNQARAVSIARGRGHGWPGQPAGGLAPAERARRDHAECGQSRIPAAAQRTDPRRHNQGSAGGDRADRWSRNSGQGSAGLTLMEGIAESPIVERTDPRRLGSVEGVLKNAPSTTWAAPFPPCRGWLSWRSSPWQRRRGLRPSSPHKPRATHLGMYLFIPPGQARWLTT